MRIPKTTSALGFRLAYVFLLILTTGCGYAIKSSFSWTATPPGPPRPHLDRKACDGAGSDPSKNTLAFDRAPASFVVYEFLYDNVFRENLAAGFRLTTLTLRSGASDSGDPVQKDKWLTGDIPVPYEPVGTACSAGARVGKTKVSAIMLVNQTFYLSEVVWQKGRWLVNYFRPVPQDQTPRG
jgi:hypothetical protein